MCGNLNGQHMYLDAGGLVNNREMKITQRFTGEVNRWVQDTYNLRYMTDLPLKDASQLFLPDFTGTKSVRLSAE